MMMVIRVCVRDSSGYPFLLPLPLPAGLNKKDSSARPAEHPFGRE